MILANSCSSVTPFRPYFSTFKALKVDRISPWGGCVGGLRSKPPAAGGKGVWAPAVQNFCIFYLKKVNFSAFNCIICCNNVLLQAWATYGPRAGSGPRDHFMRPTDTYSNMTSYRESSRRPFMFL